MSIFRRYRLLLIVIALVSMSLYRELWSKQGPPTDTRLSGPAANTGYAPKPVPDDDQMKLVLTELYPNSIDTLLNEAVEAIVRNDLVAARKALERGLDSGVKSNEDLLYIYAIILVRTNAPQAEIDAAVRRWRYNFPYSSLPDPQIRRNAAKPKLTSSPRTASSAHPVRLGFEYRSENTGR